MNNISLNHYNPFIPTKRDIDRTSELASKNPKLAGIITFIFIPAGLIYLNRGINFLKIVGYVCGVSLIFSLLIKNEDSKQIRNLISLIGTAAITTEQVMAVNKARQRLQENSSLISADNFIASNKDVLSQEIVQRLKQLKQRYEANEISEEEFKFQKENILKSI